MTVIASEAADVALILRLLGSIQVLIHGRPLPHLRSRKALWLLALMTLHAGRRVEREWLAGTLWPDTDQSRAFTSLRATLSELRGALGDRGERLQSPSRHTLVLDLAGADVDLRAFDAAMLSKNEEALKQAIGLYRGPLLEFLAEARLVVPQMAAVLGLREEPGRPLLDRLLDHLRTKRCLVVLDNCEHLVEAVAQAVAALLRECPRVRILATSREALRITGEIVWAVPALTAPDPRHLPQQRAPLLRELSGYESVHLFSDWKPLPW